MEIFIIRTNCFLTMNVLQRIEVLEDYLANKEDVLCARLYGSSCFESRKSEDVDLAVMIPSNDGVCEFSLYERLRLIKQELNMLTDDDVDLIPHTLDEVDRFSSLHFPRYNPSLIYGIDIKGIFPVKRPSPSQSFSIRELSEYVLLDSRTITRRQVLRPTSYDNVRIFLSKLAHGPGNVMTLTSYLDNSENYLVNPSDSKQSFLSFYERTGIDMNGVLSWIDVLKYSLREKTFDPVDAFPLITWYETLVSGSLKRDYSLLKQYLKFQFKRPGILLVLKDEQNRILLIHRDDKPSIANPGVWYPPTETIELEHPDQTAVRCGSEELGLELQPRFVKKDVMAAGHPRFIYVAEFPNKGKVCLKEGQDYGFFRLDQLDHLKILRGSLNFIQSLFSISP